MRCKGHCIDISSSAFQAPSPHLRGDGKTKGFFSKHLILLILLLMFLLPGILAYWFYRHPQILSGQTTNHGTLLAKPIYRDDLAKTGKWGIVLWYPKICHHTCQQTWQMLHRMRLALGRRYYQTDLWLLTDANLGQTPAIFLSDRHGYIVLRYPLESKPEPIFKDLDHLMRGSE